MAKKQPKSIQIDTYTAGIFGRTEGYADKVRRLYAEAVSQLLELAASQGVSEDEMFEFDKLPKRLRDEANKILRLLYTSVYNEVQHGIRAEWEYANLSNDIIIKRIFGDAVFKNEGNHFARWFARNQQAMDAFLKRKSGPQRLGLSERIWNYTGQLRDEMELALSVSMGQGESASTVSRKVRQYLQEPDRLFRHVKGADGKMRWSKAAKEYLRTHDVGRGQYLSSYKNAMRLTRTETNMAYRMADSERWTQLDFVLGIHIQRSKRNDNEHDICDELQGDYPKGFKFTGWHPQCRCIATPILATVDEAVAMRKAMKEGKDPRSVLAPGRYVTEPPAAFTQWVSDNRERIESAATTPYFIRDNFKDGDIDKGFAWVKAKKQKTEEEKAAIAAKWNERKRHNALITKMGNNVYNVAVGYPDVDTSDLIAAINAGRISDIEAQAKAVAQQVGAINKQLAGMKAYIADPKGWMKSEGYTVSELQACYGSIESNMQTWQNNYQTDPWLPKKYATFEDYLLHKLEYEIKDVVSKKKYSTWKVAQESYSKQYDITQDTIEWNSIKQQQAQLATAHSGGYMTAQLAALDKAVNDHDKAAAQAQIAVIHQWQPVLDVLAEALTFQTKSTPYLNLIAKLQQHIMANDLASAQATVTAMQAKRVELAKKAARRQSKNAGGIEVTSKELTKKPTDASIMVMAGRLAEKRLSDARTGKISLSAAQQDAYREMADAVRLRDSAKVLDLLKRLGDDLTSTYGQARKDAAIWAQTASEADDTFFDNAVQTYAKSTADEREAIRSYTRASGYITKYLRGIDGYLEYDYSYAQKADRHSKDMTTYVARSRMEHDLWLKRDEICAFGTYRWGLNVTELCNAEMKRTEIENELTILRQQISSYAGKAVLTTTEKDELQKWDKKKKRYESDLSKITQTVQSLVGRVGTDESFMSCGSCRGTNFSGTGGDNKYGRPRVMLNIFCPAGTCATYADPFNFYTNGNSSTPWDGHKKHAYTGENEFFMQRGTTMRITKAEYDYGKDILYLDVEVVSQHWRDFEIESVSGGGYKAKFK